MALYPDAYSQVQEICRPFGRKILLIYGEKAYAAAGKLLEEALAPASGCDDDSDALYIAAKRVFGTDCTMAAIHAVVIANAPAEMKVPLDREVLAPVLTETVNGPDMEHIPYPVTEDMVFEAMKAVEVL